MAAEITRTAVGAPVLEHQLSGIRVWGVRISHGYRFDDADVEVDQVGVVGRVALGGADSVGVVADRTGRIFIYDVRLVHSGRTVGEDDISIVALVAQCVGLRALDRTVCDAVRLLEQERPIGPVWPTDSEARRSRTSGVAVAAIDLRCLPQWVEQAGNVGVLPLIFDGVV